MLYKNVNLDQRKDAIRHCRIKENYTYQYILQNSIQDVPQANACGKVLHLKAYLFPKPIFRNKNSRITHVGVNVGNCLYKVLRRSVTTLLKVFQQFFHLFHRSISGLLKRLVNLI